MNAQDEPQSNKHVPQLGKGTEFQIYLPVTE